MRWTIGFQPFYAQRDLKDATITLMDGTGTPNELDIKIGEGNITWSEKRNIEYVKDRGVLDTTREGDQEPLEVTIDAVFEEMTSSAGFPPTVSEFLKQIGTASAYATTGGECEPYAIDIVVVFDLSCGTVLDETITFSEFRFEQEDTDLKAGTLSISGKCNAIRPTSVRAAV